MGVEADQVDACFGVGGEAFPGCADIGRIEARACDDLLRRGEALPDEVVVVVGHRVVVDGVGVERFVRRQPDVQDGQRGAARSAAGFTGDLHRLGGVLRREPVEHDPVRLRGSELHHLGPEGADHDRKALPEFHSEPRLAHQLVEGDVHPAQRRRGEWDTQTGGGLPV